MNIHYLIFGIFTLLLAGGSLAENATVPADETQPFAVTVGWNGVVSLSGYVTDDEARESVHTTATSLFAGIEIQNQIKTGSAADSGWSRNGRWGMSQLKKLESGTLEYSGHHVFLEGECSSAELAEYIQAAALGLKPSVEKRLNIHVRE